MIRCCLYNFVEWALVMNEEFLRVLTSMYSYMRLITTVGPDDHLRGCSEILFKNQSFGSNTIH